MTDRLRGPKDHSNRTDWWFVDSRGRKIGYMWPEDMLSIIESIWGHTQGIKNFALYTGVTRSQIERYCNGKVPIQKAMALLVLSLQELMLERDAHNKRYPWRHIPRCETPWLPERRREEIYKLDTKPFG